jgi:hypothetical protein
MQQKKSLVLLVGNFPHHLDHLAPFAGEIGAPLCILEESLYLLAKKTYPNLKVFHTNFFHLLTQHLKKYDQIISCVSIRVFEEAFASFKHLSYFWLPHGHSDKGFTQEKYFRLFAEEQNLLLYGNHLLDQMKKSGALKTANSHVIKNFRYYHYCKNRKFYDSKVQDLSLDLSKPTLLYAPTWQDKEDSSSFSHFSNHLEKLKKNYSVICKWHPNLLVKEKEQIKKIEEKNPEITFLHEFAPIYPLLSVCSIYVGDVSSIGYDFLTFQRPMVFLDEHSRDYPLFSCGTVLPKEEYKNIEIALERAISDHKNKYIYKQIELYEYTFGKKEPIDAFNKHFALLKKQFENPAKVV